MIIDGKRIFSRKKFGVYNPYDNSLLEYVSSASINDISRALKLSFNTNTILSIDEKKDLLKEAYRKLSTQKNEFAKLISTESGLCLKDTLHEVDRTLKVIEYSIGILPLVRGDLTDNYLIDGNSSPKLKVISEPFDLSVAITPFNHPLNQVAHKICPAISAGASVVLKPSEKTPLTAIKFIELLHECGLPRNSVNLITGIPPRNIVFSMIKNPLVDLITFTGGLSTGRNMQKYLTKSNRGNVKQIYELGGSSPLFVAEDADVQKAVRIAMSIFKNSGQRCTNIRKILLSNKIADYFISEFLESASKLQYSDPLNPKTDVGTLINNKAAKIVEKRVDQAILKGAKLILGNERKGALYSPTILDNVPPACGLIAKETFGPVAPIIRVKNIKEAVEITNKSRYKLAGSIVTGSESLALGFANSIKVGQFNYNGSPGYRKESAPFGGFGDSGNAAKEGVISLANEYRRIRTFYSHDV